MDTDSFLMHIKTEDFYKDIAGDVERMYDTSNYNYERPLPIGKNKKKIGYMKDVLGGKIMKEFIGLRPKCYSYLTDDGFIDKKAKGTIKCVIKKEIMFNEYLECLKEKKKILRNQQRFRSDAHDIYTEKVNKVALSFNDDKRLISYHVITSYPFGISAGFLIKQELLSKAKKKKLII